ncbi:MAG: hypothetical protein PVG65_06290 [Candidatus Thorarchaeota archaeon]
MKKSLLTISLSIVLFSFINIGLAQAGTVTIKVQYQDDCPRSDALVKEVYNRNYIVGATDESGYVSDSGFQPNTIYRFEAYWPDLGHQFGPRETIVTNETGDGSVTITDSSNYTDGTETCGGDSECDGYRYCIGDPKYIECDSWDTECGTLDCCQCDGGTYAEPTQNYDIQNEDCGFCEKCSALDNCSYAIGTDPKEECPEDLCKYGYCDGSGACDMKPDTTDCGICALCDGSGNCDVYDPNQNEDCLDTPCPDGCGLNPDNNPFTWDYANDEPNYCQALGTCTANLCSYQHTCADNDDTDGHFLWDGLYRTCTAPCDQDVDCGNECDGKKWYSFYRCSDLSCDCELSDPICMVGKCGAECDSDDVCEGLYGSGSVCLENCTCEGGCDLPWDVNGDNYVGIDDIVETADHFGCTPSQNSECEKYDVNDDDYVGIDDIVEVAEHFGESC